MQPIMKLFIPVYNTLKSFCIEVLIYSENIIIASFAGENHVEIPKLTKCTIHVDTMIHHT